MMVDVLSTDILCFTWKSIANTSQFNLAKRRCGFHQHVASGESQDVDRLGLVEPLTKTNKCQQQQQKKV